MSGIYKKKKSVYGLAVAKPSDISLETAIL